MKEIISSELPPPNGHYSHAVIFNGAVYVSGILPMGVKPEDSLVDQFNDVFKTLKKILQESGSDFDHVVHSRIYIASLKDWPEINRLYSEVMVDRKPARVVVLVKELHFGYRLEVEMMASLRK